MADFSLALKNSSDLSVFDISSRQVQIYKTVEVSPGTLAGHLSVGKQFADCGTSRWIYAHFAVPVVLPIGYDREEPLLFASTKNWSTEWGTRYSAIPIQFHYGTMRSMTFPRSGLSSENGQTTCDIDDTPTGWGSEAAGYPQSVPDPVGETILGGYRPVHSRPTNPPGGTFAYFGTQYSFDRLIAPALEPHDFVGGSITHNNTTRTVIRARRLSNNKIRLTWNGQPVGLPSSIYFNQTWKCAYVCTPGLDVTRDSDLKMTLSIGVKNDLPDTAEESVTHGLLITVPTGYGTYDIKYHSNRKVFQAENIKTTGDNFHPTVTGVAGQYWNPSKAPNIGPKIIPPNQSIPGQTYNPDTAAFLVNGLMGPTWCCSDGGVAPYSYGGNFFSSSAEKLVALAPCLTFAHPNVGSYIATKLTYNSFTSSIEPAGPSSSDKFHARIGHAVISSKLQDNSYGFSELTYGRRITVIQGVIK